MYCPGCGTEIPEDSLFCPSCGGRVANSQTKKENDATNISIETDTDKGDIDVEGSIASDFENVDIEIPSITGKKILTFTENSIIFGNKCINYKDIDGVSCKQIYHSTNLIPTHQEYSFVFYGNNDRIDVNFGTTLHIGTESRKEIFNQLYVISKSFLAPIILRKIVKDIIDNGKTINIGGVNFTKEGYYKKGFMGLGGENWVHWTDSIGEPGMTDGNIILYKSDGAKYKHFASIPLEICNALVVPDLVSAMYSIRNNL